MKISKYVKLAFCCHHTANEEEHCGIAGGFHSSENNSLQITLRVKKKPIYKKTHLADGYQSFYRL